MPIFVIGFPRSGTSLVEQILASHSAVQGAGELEDLGRLADAASLFASPEQACRDLARLTPETARSLAARYLGKLQAVSGGRTRVVDKMPHNFQDLWLIALLFPNAVILHCVRSPEDTCLSCFCTKFAKGYAYTDDLVALGRHYQYYRNVMELWKAVIPMPLHEVRYERLVANPEQGIRRLLEKCGLGFEEACLSFHTTQRPVRTASALQVRQKMYASAVGKWRRYAKHLGPLLEILQQGRPPGGTGKDPQPDEDARGTRTNTPDIHASGTI